MMGEIRSHKELTIWQRAMSLVEKVYRLTQDLPTQEQWGLTSQMRRAVVSVPSNIAEGYGRQATGEYRRHLSITRGSLLELETQIILSQRLNYCEDKKANDLCDEINQLTRMISAIIAKLDTQSR